MIRRNDSDSYPGATHYAFAPVSSGDCCLHQTLADLGVALSAAGRPYTFRGARLYFNIEEADLLTLCQGVAPTIEGMDSVDWEDAVQRTIDVTDRGAEEGEVWVGDKATWAECEVKVEQTVDTWANGDVVVTTVQGGFPLSPPAAYAYVMNACGRPNAVGFEIAWIEV